MSDGPRERPTSWSGVAAYGDAFADVYDDWYPDGERSAEVVELLGVPGAGRLLELGVGTGTLAVPLARRGWSVCGLDSSAAMLERLAARARRDRVEVAGIRGDAGDPATWPDGPFEVVLAANNLVANLIAEHAPQRMLEGAAARLTPGGRLVVELMIVAPPPRRSRRLVASPDTDGVRIHTDTDPATRLIRGCHVTSSGDDLELRRWTVRWIDPSALDLRAARAGLGLDARWAGLDRSPYVEGESPRHVSTYRATRAT
ncbi:MAG TPA: methyltransferase domain-containing protein [Microthrixaceae bacterium]|nr:methyltransferase domain-containing protein [Microthrixaceae bacterium]